MSNLGSMLLIPAKGTSAAAAPTGVIQYLLLLMNWTV